jgi:hypothetical protein
MYRNRSRIGLKWLSRTVVIGIMSMGLLTVGCGSMAEVDNESATGFAGKGDSIDDFKFVGNYACSARGDILRQQGGERYAGDVKLFFTKYTDSAGQTVLRQVLGHVVASYEADSGAPLDALMSYYAHFNFDELAENLDYNPDKYVGYSQFPDFDTVITNGRDGGGMWGYFVVEKDTSENGFAAHYIFHAGDHMGGSIDLICADRWQS